MARRNAREQERTQVLAKMKADSDPESGEITSVFMNHFYCLEVENLPIKEEADLDQLAKSGGSLETEGNTSEQPIRASTGTGRRKRKSRRVAAEPLDNYKVKSETEAYFAVRMFLRDVLNLRKSVSHALPQIISDEHRYMRDIWRQVGLGQLHCAIAGALSNVAVGMITSLQYELSMDYPDCKHYRQIINQLVRNDNYQAIGAAVPTKTGISKVKANSMEIALSRKGDMVAIEEALLLTTHNDLVAFITDFRKNRTRKPTSMYSKTNWNPNFRDTHFTLAAEMTPQNVRKWKSDYIISWLYDFVNTYAAMRLRKSNPREKNLEKLDWKFEDPTNCEWTNRPLWGPVDFAYDVTVLAMQKPGAPLEEELKPHHILQLQIAGDSMFCAKRWVAQDVDPIDCFGSTSSTLVWDFANDVVEVRRFRDQWIVATQNLVKEFKVDRDRKGDPTEWSHPIANLEFLMRDAFALGEIVTSLDDDAPRSLFSRSSTNGL